MKKTLLFIVIISAFSLTASAQNRLTKAINLFEKGYGKNVKAVLITPIDNKKIVPLSTNNLSAVGKVNHTGSGSKITSVTDDFIGATYYDLQTNGSIGNRFLRNSGGTMSAVWTGSCGNQAIDRGTSYNYWDGTQWTNPAPTLNCGIIETVRTGYTNIVVTSSGHEMAIAHSSAQTGLNQCYRAATGTGSWTDLTPMGTGNNDTWARAIAGGVNGNSVHVICQGTGATAIPINGQDGPLYYFRSIDGGVTFPVAHQVLPGLDSANTYGFGGDSYSIDSRGDVIAIAVGGFTTNMYLLKSIDNGNTWTNTVVFQSPIPQPYDGTTPFPDLNGDGMSDTLELPSGDVHVMIDNNNLCHLWWSTALCVNDGTGTGYYPNMLDGLYYWNENMGSGPGYIIAHAPDLDGDGKITIPTSGMGGGNGMGNYRGSVTQMPSSGIDAAGNLYVSYQTFNETTDTTIYNTGYKQIYIIKSTDGGVTWTNPDQAYNILQDQDSTIEEGVFACMAKYVDNDIYILYQRDYAPGHSLSTNTTEAGWNAGVPSDIIAGHFPVSAIPAASCGAYFTLSPDTTIPHHWIAVNYASGVAPITYLWSWGDGTTSSGATPSHTYATGGFYNICLTITDNAGCSSSMCDSSYFYKGTSGNSMVTISVVSSTTGTSESLPIDYSFSVYPNPAKTKLVIDAENIQQIIVTNTLGEKLIDKNFPFSSGSKKELDISHLAKGIYFIKAGNQIRKFVKE